MPSVNGLQDLRNLQNVCHSHNLYNSKNLQNLHFLPHIAKVAFFAPLIFFALTLFFPIFAYAQSINISNFYYRDYLDFGQNKGIFKDGAKQNGAFTITGKDGSTLIIPRIPTFQASSNYGSLTSVGRGFAVTASHVTSPESAVGLLNWGLTEYKIANQTVQTSDGDINGISKIYGYDTKFLRLSKYVVEGQIEMLDIENTKKKDSTKETLDKNIQTFKEQVDSNFKNGDKVYLYQSGSGIVTLQGTNIIPSPTFNTDGTGERRGGGFGTFGSAVDYYNNGIAFYYIPQTGFYNQITSGDSGSGIYAYNTKDNKWVLLGVVSRDNGAISVASNKDFTDYQQNFEQNIKIENNNNLSLEKPGAGNIQLKGNNKAYIFQNNKDIIFRGSGEINIEVKTDIIRNQSGYAGGFVFEASDSTKSTTYKFTNQNGKIYSFNGSGLDIGENVNVEWHLKNYKDEKTDKDNSLHKVGKGTLTIKTQNTEITNLGTLKIGEGKVTLDTSKKAFDNIYITSGRGELALTKDKAEALGAIKNSTTARGDSPSVNSYTLSQSKNSEMGFYFGTGGGRLDLGGNSLTLNTIAANDKNAIITNTSGSATLTIEGLGYKDGGEDNPKVKDTTKANTIIHASIGESDSAGGTNIDIVYSGEKTAQSATNANNAHLIFDGNINTSGKMSVSNGNVALQGHATAHATISDASIRDKVKTAESGTVKAMPDYMDLEKPSTLTQPNWDSRTFKFGTGGIALTNSTLTLGRNASLESAITLDKDSKVEFGGGVAHFIDNLDGKNVTGSGFSYQQEVTGGNLTGEALKGASESISYKGKITANGGTIKSSIWDFNASLELKGSANLTADYLTLNSNSSVSLESSASASVKTLKLNNVSDSNLASIFKNSTSGTNPKLKVTEKIWFENANNLTLMQLDSANFDRTTHYDIYATKSSVNDRQKEITANVSLFEGSNFSLKSLTLTNTNVQSAESSAESIKNKVYLLGNTSGKDFTKLNLTSNLKAQNLDSANIELYGKSEINTPKIEFDNIKDGKLILGNEAKLTSINNQNTTVEVKNSSQLKISMGGEKRFDINASGANTNITLGLLQNAESSVDSAPNVNYSGKITASDSSVVASALESITASVDLSGTAKLTAQNIELTNGFDSIKLQGGANLTAEKITAKNVSNLTLQTNGATANVKEFIFDGGATNLTGNLIGDKITLQNASVVKNGDLSFSSDVSVNFGDKDSKLEVQNLKVTSGNLSLIFHDSKANGGSISKIDLSGGSVNISAWDFGNATQFSSNGTGRVTFGSASYAQNGSAKTISADSTISGALSLSSVGKKQNNNANFEALKFSGKNLTLGVDSTISVAFDESVSKSGYFTAGITLGAYYTLISTGGITDNRANKIIDFTFSNPNDALFVAYKIIGNDLQIKFTESDPRTFSELNKHINPRYSDVLKALTEAHPSDYAIEVAANTDDYAVLESRIRGIDSAMNEIAQGNKSRVTQNLLFSNEHTINTRISQVRLARASHNKSPLRFAQNGTLYRLQKLRGEVVASDAMPSYATTSVKNGDKLPNNAWLNVGGGYFGGDSQMGFGATNIGYDRLFNADNGDVLVGAMLGFGGYKASAGDLSDTARFYNLGFYVDSIFDKRSEIYGGHKVQGNLNLSLSDKNLTFKSNNISSTALGALFSLYYKYNFIVAENEYISHAVKPIALLLLGYNHNSAWEGAEYKQGAYNSVAFAYGAGVEYNAVLKDSFYSVALVLKDNAYNSGGRVDISLKGARNFIGYTIELSPRISAEVNMIGSHNLINALYLQYGITGMVDSGANYGVKGDVKVGYKF